MGVDGKRGIIATGGILGMGGVKRCTTFVSCTAGDGPCNSGDTYAKNGTNLHELREECERQTLLMSWEVDWTGYMAMFM